MEIPGSRSFSLASKSVLPLWDERLAGSGSKRCFFVTDAVEMLDAGLN
jgi:hypothetical protein